MCVFDAFENERFDFVLRQAVCCLHFNRRLLPATLFLCGHGQHAIRIDQERDVDLRQLREHWRYAGQFELTEQATVLRQFAFALIDVDDDRGLIVCGGRVPRRFAARHRRVPVDEFIDDATERFDAERQRYDIEQQHVASATRKDVRLHGGPHRDDFIGVQIRVWRTAKKLADTFPYVRDSRRSADEHDFVDLLRGELRIA